MCPHCGHSVSTKTYLAHKRVYYDDDSDQWIKVRKLDSCDFLVEDLDFDEDGGSAAQTDLPPPLVDFDKHRSEGVCQILYLIYLPFS